MTLREMKPGTLVMLNSGGPKMTVNGDLDKLGYVTCVWFNSGYTELRQGCFRPECLTVVNDKK